MSSHYKPIDLVLKKLQGHHLTTTSEDHWSAKCPAHNGEGNTSLSISVGDDDRVLLHCFGSCTPEAIVKVLKLEMADLFRKKPSRNGKAVAPGNWREKGERYAKKLRDHPAQLTRLAAILGIPVDALRHIDVLGWDDWIKTGPRWTWPERDGTGTIIGIATRMEEGAKKTMSGSKRGIVLPRGWENGLDPLFVSEGFSDCVAMLAAGFTCIARPMKSVKPDSAAAMIGTAIQKSPHQKIIFLADADDGKADGNAAQICARLAKQFPDRTFGWAIPSDGAKDARQWLTSRPESESWPDRGKALQAALQILPPPAVVEKPPRSSEGVSTGRRVVTIGTDEARVTDEVIEAIVNDDGIYQRGGELVRVINEPPAGPRIQILPAPALRDRVTRIVSFQKNGANDSITPRHPPDWLIPAVATRGEWPVRCLRGLITSPIIRADGSILTAHGYDPATGVYLHWPGEALQIPEKPTLDDARVAVAELLEVVEDFPFQASMHRSGWLAGLLTSLCREAFDGPSPLFLVDGNIRGSGKGLLLHVNGTILTGSSVPVTSYPTGKNAEAEARKLITSILLNGDRLALFDNITGSFGDSALDALLTARTWKDRILGVNKTVELPISTTFYGTGNNIEPRGDTGAASATFAWSPHSKNRRSGATSGTRI